MIPTTPKKLVHWESQEVSFSEFGSPFGNGSTDSMASTSTVEYINSQLVAHGFVNAPGLSLEGISNANSEKLVKCLLGMLSQRVEDMARTEELTTKFRTLSYDNERLMTMHRNASERAANAEREMNIYKTRLTTTTRSLQAAESAHKQTMTELQRTRTTVQAIRSSHNAELKKKEKEMERMTDKWIKIADTQTKLLNAPSGMRCANVAVVDGSEVLGKGQGFLEIALDQSEKARSQFSDENLHLKRLILKAVNEIQRLLHDPQLQNSATAEEPTEYSLATLFPLSPSTAASTTLSNMLTSFREYVASLSELKINTSSTKSSPGVPDGEIERLQNIINSLKEEIERSQKQTMAHAAETQAMFDKFAEDHRTTHRDIGEMSVELLSIPLQDDAKARLDKMRAELDQERKIFTDAAIKLGREKAALEMERVKLLDEKRIWQVEMMLADLPPTPLPLSPMKATRLSPHKPPQKSPKKSPSKLITVGKTSSRKTTRVARRSSTTPIKVIAPYETEVLPPLPAPSFLTLKPLQPAVSLLATSFVLPPPSPHASLPTKPALPPPTLPHEPQATVTSAFIPSESGHMPSTPPVRHSFPVAKPFAQRMMHAYSPAKPSPLSRILMLADSPTTPGNEFDTSPSSGPLQAVAEEPEDDEGLGLGTDRLFPQVTEAQMSLAAELGVESPPHIPLQEMNVEPNKAVGNRRSGATARERVFHPNRKNPLTAQEKAKGKAEPIPSSTTTTVRYGKTTSSAVGEKENNDGCKAGKVSPVLEGGALKSMPGDPKKVVKRSATSTSMPRAKLVAKLPPSARGGPRRVLVDSADAPPIGKGWRG